MYILSRLLFPHCHDPPPPLPPPGCLSASSSSPSSALPFSCVFKNLLPSILQTQTRHPVCWPLPLLQSTSEKRLSPCSLFSHPSLFILPFVSVKDLSFGEMDQVRSLVSPATTISVIRRQNQACQFLMGVRIQI